METNNAPPNTSRLPKRSARRLEKPMPMIIEMMPAALNMLYAEVGASLGHWNSVRPIPVSTAFSPPIRRLKPTSSRNRPSAPGSR
ncbi:hypothetical protein D3C86_2103300 [compost metagenome]